MKRRSFFGLVSGLVVGCMMPFKAAAAGSRYYVYGADTPPSASECDDTGHVLFYVDDDGNWIGLSPSISHWQDKSDET